ncbi:MAG: hypothetical protein CMJ83_09840 [Planctomycetes bacterium]|nr:hypothetical protein [Planctomycetota bacterium]
MSDSDTSRPLDELLLDRRAFLGRWIRKEASGLLRFETEEDLVQGICQRALARADAFTYDGEDAFVGWLLTLARRHVADRHDYWSALKRGSSRVLRLTWGGSTPGDPLANIVPVDTVTGPGTFAARKEALVHLSRALSALPERDRKLVLWSGEGKSLQEQADALGITYAAAQRAGLRAMERLKKTFELVARS